MMIFFFFLPLFKHRNLFIYVTILLLASILFLTRFTFHVFFFFFFFFFGYNSTVYYGEYQCYGPGANRAKRVGWSKSLSNQEATPFLTKDMIGGQGWLRPSPTHFKRGSTIVKANVP